MKLLYGIISNVHGFIQNEFRIFIIMFIALIATSFSSLLLFSFSIETRIEYEKEFGFNVRTYAINCENTDSKKTQKMLGNLDNYFSQKKIRISELSLRSVASEKLKCNIIGYYSNKDLFYCREGKSYKNLDINTSDRIIIPCEELVDYTKKTSYLNDIFKIQDLEYKIVGVAMNCPKNTVYIPYKIFINDGYDISSISIIPDKKLSTKEDKSFMDYIKSYIPDTEILGPPLTDQKEESRFFAKFIQYICLLIFALINVIQLFNYWLYKNGPRFIISKLCGASNGFLYRMIVLESLLYSSASFILGYLIYLLLVPFLKRVNAYVSLSYFNISTAYFIMTIVVYILVHRTAIKIIRKTDLQNFRWGELV